MSIDETTHLNVVNIENPINVPVEPVELPDKYDPTRIDTWGPGAIGLAAPLGYGESLPSNGAIDFATGQIYGGTGNEGTDGSPSNVNQKLKDDLAKLKVDAGQVVETDDSGKPLTPRDPKDVTNIVIREGHKAGDPPPNFVIDKDGKIREVVDPTKSRREGDNSAIIEIDYQDGAKAATQQQRTAAIGLIEAMKQNFAAAQIAPDIPDDLIAAANAADPPPVPVTRYTGGGGIAHGGFGAPTGGYSGGGFTGGGGERPLIKPQVNKEGHLQPAIPKNSDLFKALDMNKLTDRIIAGTGAMESGGNFSSINHHDNGAGWSVGIRQWNQNAGEMPTLIQAMYDRDPAKFNADFGQYAGQLIHNGRVNESFVRSANFDSMPGFTQDMQKALGDFKDVQIALSRQWAQSGIDMATKYGFKSELGMAEVSDAINQYGYAGAESRLKKLGNGGDELSRIEQFDRMLGHQRGSRLAQLEQKFSADKTATA